MNKMSRMRWFDFSLQDRLKCFNVGYQCLKDGLYWWDGEAWRCGCENAQ